MVLIPRRRMFSLTSASVAVSGAQTASSITRIRGFLHKARSEFPGAVAAHRLSSSAFAQDVVKGIGQGQNILINTGIFGGLDNILHCNGFIPHGNIIQHRAECADVTSPPVSLLACSADTVIINAINADFASAPGLIALVIILAIVDLPLPMNRPGQSNRRPGGSGSSPE